MGIAAEDLSGRWDSNWGAVTLSGAGDTLTGTWAEGGLDGRIDGDKLRLTWTHRTGTSGKASLLIGDGGATLAGTWGFDDKDAGEGDWSLKLVEPAKKAAPPAEPAAEAPAAEAPAADAPAGEGDAAPAPAEEPKAEGKKKK